MTGPDGKPVADAMVSVDNGSLGHWEGASSSRTDADGNYKIADAPAFDMAGYQKEMAEQERRMKALAATGGNTYTLFIMRPGLTVEHPDFATLRTQFEKSPGTQDVQLESPAILEGLVTFPDSKPAAGALVTATTSIEVGTTLPKATSLPVFYKASATANADGKYRIASLPNGKYDLWADLPDWVNTGVNEIAATSGKTANVPDLTLTKGALVSARFVDTKTKEPIPLPADAKALLLAQPMPLRRGRSMPNRHISANADGRFELRTTPGKQLVLVGGIEVDGASKWYGETPAEVTVAEGQTTAIDVLRAGRQNPERSH